MLGLVSEAGEVADKDKKIIRDDEIDIVDPLLDLTEDQRKAIALELSDCLYTSWCCSRCRLRPRRNR